MSAGDINVDPEGLANDLIANRSGTGSIAEVFRFLSEHHDDVAARAEFVRFLRGERPELLFRTARHAVQTRIAAFDVHE
jgi:hypothetical protein